MKKIFQKTLILVFEVILQPPKYTFEIGFFSRFSSLCEASIFFVAEFIRVYKVNKQTNEQKILPFLWNPCCNIRLVNHETFLVVLLMLANFLDKADNCIRSYTSLNFELFHLLALQQKSDSKCQ